MAKTKNKKKSQAPIALVYFTTLLVFLVVIGLAVMMLFNKYDFLGTDNDSNANVSGYSESDCMTTLYAHVNTKGVLCEAMLLRFSPTSSDIVVVPLSPYTYDSQNKMTLRDVHKSGGITELKKSVEETTGVTVDRYMAVTNTAVNEVCDLLGGYSYTPVEDLYYLATDAESSDDYIAIKKGTTTQLTGQQIRLILSYPVFSEGKMGNVKFMAEAFTGMINNAFKQVDLTMNNLDTLYNLAITDAETDFTKEDYAAQKKILLVMLDEGLTPAHSLVPTGTWDDEQTKFTISDAFKEQLQETFTVTYTSYSAATTTNDTASATDTATASTAE